MEPPAKLTKFEMESQYLEGEVMEEGQEEWLSEGVLTDDDYNPASQETQEVQEALADQNDSNVGSSQDESMNAASADDSQNLPEADDSQIMPEADDSQSLPEADDSQNLPEADDSQNLPEADDSQNLPEADDSQNLPEADDSQNLPEADDSQNLTDVSSQNMDTSVKYQNMDTSVSNIEETLNNLENSEICNQISDFPEELNAFLIRKTDGKVIGSEALKKDSDVDESVKQSDDDGNDTDDLLRVLGDGDQSSKHIKKEKVLIQSEHGDFSDGDDFIFGGGNTLKKASSLNVAKSVLSRAPATKAEPEGDVTDCSSDEANSFSKMFTYKKSKVATGKSVTPQISTTVKPGNVTITPLETRAQPKKRIVRRVVEVVTTKQKTTMPEKIIEVKRPPTTPRRQYVNKRAGQGASLLKYNSSGNKPQPEEKMHEEYLDDEHVKDHTHKPKESKPKQQMMRPEVMDEDVPSDAESVSDEESLYSELPSSESDSEDWFTLDIRAEKAGDYIPLLGDRAYQLLSEERTRVRERLDTLRDSLAALSGSGRELAEQLKDATNTVAELDAMLKAA